VIFSGPQGTLAGLDQANILIPRSLAGRGPVDVVLTVGGKKANISPAELGPEADPTSDYLARPPWYFLPLFQLLKYFPGKLSVIPTVVLPCALFTLIFLLPLIDRREERHPLKRPIATTALVLILLGATGLIWLSKHQDRANPDFSALLKQQDEDARGFLRTSFQPQEVGRAKAERLTADPKLLAISANRLRLSLKTARHVTEIAAKAIPGRRCSASPRKRGARKRTC